MAAINKTFENTLKLQKSNRKVSKEYERKDNNLRRIYAQHKENYSQGKTKASKNMAIIFQKYSQSK